MKKSVFIEFFVLAAIWGASFLFTRVASAEFGVFPTAAMRVGIAAAVMLPFLLRSKHWGAFKQHAKPILFVGLLNSVSHLPYMPMLSCQSPPGYRPY